MARIILDVDLAGSLLYEATTGRETELRERGNECYAIAHALGGIYRAKYVLERKIEKPGITEERRQEWRTDHAEAKSMLAELISNSEEITKTLNLELPQGE